MRNSARSAAAVAASVALLTVGAPTASQAYTEKELSICYVNKTPVPTLDLELVADGPSYKAASFDAGDCQAWDVRPGQYKVTFEDLDELYEASSAEYCQADYYAGVQITIKRMHESYKVFNFSVVDNGAFSIDVKKDRRTSITFLVKCVRIPE